MAREQIEVNGVMVDLRNPKELLQGVNEVIALEAPVDLSDPASSAEVTKQYMATLSFFGSLKHYLKGGIE